MTDKEMIKVPGEYIVIQNTQTEEYHLGEDLKSDHWETYNMHSKDRDMLKVKDAKRVEEVDKFVLVEFLKSRHVTYRLLAKHYHQEVFNIENGYN